MKKISIKIIVILAILMLLFSINSKVFAWSDIIQNGKSFINDGQTATDKNGEKYANIGEKELQDLSGFLYNILLTAGVVIAVIVAVVLGIHFITGGAEGQAKVKEMLIPFIAGCIIVFGGFSIWKLALSIGNKIENAETIQNHGDPTTEYIVEGGKYYCGNCGDPLNNPEIYRGICDSCGYSIDGL